MELEAELVHVFWDDSPPWPGYQDWCDLLFMSWPVPVEEIGPKIPSYFEPDTFEGSAWVSLVAMGVQNQHLRDLPPIPGFARYEQLNLRTYIKKDHHHGVHFFTLDCNNSASGWIADNLLNIPYTRAEIQHVLQDGRWHFNSNRTEPAYPSAQFKVAYTSVGEEYVPYGKETLEYFLLHRYYLGLADDNGTNILHKHWKLYKAEVEIETNTVAAASGINLPDTPPHVFYCSRIETLLYPQIRLDKQTETKIGSGAPRP